MSTNNFKIMRISQLNKVTNLSNTTNVQYSDVTWTSTDNNYFTISPDPTILLCNQEGYYNITINTSYSFGYYTVVALYINDPHNMLTAEGGYNTYVNVPIYKGSKLTLQNDSGLSNNIVFEYISS